MMPIRPWVLILVGWAVVLGAMSAAVVISIKHRPESVPLQEQKGKRNGN